MVRIIYPGIFISDYLWIRLIFYGFIALDVPSTTERPPSCASSPCGPNSLCQIISGIPACSCLPNYIGVPPECRPECILSSECKSHLACVNQRCQDPCPGSCGVNAQCHVLNHIPVCTCMEDFTGDPFTQCTIIPPSKTTIQILISPSKWFHDL